VRRHLAGERESNNARATCRAINFVRFKTYARRSSSRLFRAAVRRSRRREGAAGSFIQDAFIIQEETSVE